MKLYAFLWSVILATGLLAMGCGKSGDSAAKVDPAPVEKSFASADPALKAAADKAVAAIKGADYSSAVVELQKLSSNAKVTDEQKKAVNDVLAQVQKAVADAGTKAAGDANKALGDVQKSLGK